MSNGYNDKKEYTCICCGDKVLLTKFASALKAKCDSCKKSNASPNPDILAQVQSGNKSRTKSTKTVDNDPNIPDDMKKSVCIQCGTETLVTKFASHAKTLCNECKGSGQSRATSSSSSIKIDISKMNYSKLPKIDEMYVIPSVIANHNLRDVKCPACHNKHPMKIVKIVDSDPQRGLVITYQCGDTSCMTVMTLSEQATNMIYPSPSWKFFNYRGEEIQGLLSAVTNTRIKNSMEYMYKLLVDNGIEVDGSTFPKFLREYDVNKTQSDKVKGFSKEAL